MVKIKISRIAYGSLSTTIGDGTLGYSGGTSYKAQEVCGLYIDIPPVLSRDYSSLIWQYNVDTDRYLLTHVQGRHVVDQAMGRIFPYRGAYEVTREEMNRLGFPLADVMASMPRIQQFTTCEEWEDEMDYVKYHKHANANRVKGLAELLVYAIAAKKRVYISIPTRDRVLRENGVFSAEEFSVLVEAIDSLEINVRRNISFAFCVDEHYQKALDEVLVTFYVRESDFQVPEGEMNVEYEQIKPLNAAERLKDYLTVMKMLNGEKEPLLPLAKMQEQVQKDKASFDAVNRIIHGGATADDMKLWFESVNVLQGQIQRFKTIVDAKSLSRVVSVLDASRDKELIRQLFVMRKNKRDGVTRIIEEGLKQIAIRKLTELGPNTESWMRFLNELKDNGQRTTDNGQELKDNGQRTTDNGQELKDNGQRTTDNGNVSQPQTFYLSMINKMGDQYVDVLRSDMVEYGIAHPRNAKDPRYELIAKTLHLQSQKKKKLTTEPKNPSNSQMQEEKGRTTNFVEEDSERCFDEFDRFYEQLQQEEEKSQKKGKMIAAALSFMFGIVLAAAVCFFVFKPTEQSAPGNDNGQSAGDSLSPVTITLADSTASILIQMANTQTDATNLVAPDSVISIDELKYITHFSQFDSVYASWIRKYADTLKIKQMKVEVK